MYVCTKGAGAILARVGANYLLYKFKSPKGPQGILAIFQNFIWNVLLYICMYVCMY